MTYCLPDRGSCDSCGAPVPQMIGKCWDCYEVDHGEKALKECQKKYLNVYPADWNEDDALIGESLKP